MIAWKFLYLKFSRFSSERRLIVEVNPNHYSALVHPTKTWGSRHQSETWHGHTSQSGLKRNYQKYFSFRHGPRQFWIIQTLTVLQVVRSNNDRWLFKKLIPRHWWPWQLINITTIYNLLMKNCFVEQIRPHYNIDTDCYCLFSSVRSDINSITSDNRWTVFPVLITSYHLIWVYTAVCLWWLTCSRAAIIMIVLSYFSRLQANINVVAVYRCKFIIIIIIITLPPSVLIYFHTQQTQHCAQLCSVVLLVVANNAKVLLLEQEDNNENHFRNEWLGSN